MSLDYVADPTATQAPSAAPAPGNLPTGRIPTDGQALNVASVWQVFKALLDYAGFITTYGAFITIANTFAERQTFNDGILAGAAPGSGWKLLDGAYNAVTGTSCWIGTGRRLISVNADWTSGTAKWSCGNTGQAATALYIDNGSMILLHHGATAGTWNDGVGGGAWTARFTLDLTSGDLTSIRNLTATLLQATTDVVAGRDIYNVSGKVEAAGTVAGDTGPGLVKGKRFYSTGTALVAGDFTLDLAGKWGGTASVAVTGSDMAGTVTVTSNGAGQLANPTLKLTFKDGTFTNAPTVIWSMKGGTGVPAGPNGVEWAVTATDTTVTMFGTPANGSTYIFSWIVVGN